MMRFKRYCKTLILATKPRQGEGEAYVSQFQVTSKSACADEKWQLMERIYETD